MKIISPSVLAALNCDPAQIKIFKTGISFNRSAQNLLALKLNDRFILGIDDKNNLYYQESYLTDSFLITQAMIKGGCRAPQNHLLEFLYPDKKPSSVLFSIGEPAEGRRLLTPVESKS